MIGIEIGYRQLKAAWTGPDGTVVATGATASPWSQGPVASARPPGPAEIRSLAEALKKLIREGPVKRGPAVVALPSRLVSVFFRDLERYSDFTAEERSYTAWRLSQSLPAGLRSGQCLAYQHVLTSPTEETRRFRIMVLVAAEELVNGIGDAVEEAGLDPVGFLPELLAAVNALDERLETTGLVAWIQMGVSGAAIALLDRGVPLLYRFSEWGLDRLVERAARQMSQDVAQVSTMLSSGGLTGRGDLDAVRLKGLSDSIVPLLQEIHLTVQYHMREVGRSDLSQVVVGGGGALVPGLDALLSGVIGVPCTTLARWLAGGRLPSGREDTFAAALGAARVERGDA